MASNIKPGPNQQGFVINPPSAGGGTPVEITALTDSDTIPGYPTPEYDPIKLATVVELTGSGVQAETSYTGVYILPDPSYAAVGDKGLMVTYTPQITAGGGLALVSNIRYITLNKAEFTKYTP